MNRPRGRPAQGAGVTREQIVAAALALLDEGGGQQLSMRALASRLGVTPMSLYHHVDDHAGLLRAVSDRVYAPVLDQALTSCGPVGRAGALEEIRAILLGYHEAVRRHPQLTLAIFTVPAAFAGVTRQITERLTALLAEVTVQPGVWRDILVDHAHGSALPPPWPPADSDPDPDSDPAPRTPQQDALHAYRRALDCLLGQLAQR